MWLNAWLIMIFATAIHAQDLRSVLHVHPSLSRLSSLLEQFDLLESLSSLNNITILAPNNAAIQDLEDFGFDFNSVEPIIVQALLTYHVLNGMFPDQSLSDSPQFLPTLLQPPLVTNVSGGAVVKGHLNDGDVVFESGLRKRAKTIDNNIHFTDGLIHTIDSTLIFPHNISVTAAVSGMTSFLEALHTAELVSTVESLADVTVFLPSNQAFKDFRSASLTRRNDQIASTLQYHIIPSGVIYSTSLLSSSFETLEGTNLSVTTRNNGDIYINNARIVSSDLLIYGGVGHVIDKVLLPEEGASTLTSTSGVRETLKTIDDVIKSDSSSKPIGCRSTFCRFILRNVELSGIGAVFVLAIAVSMLIFTCYDGRFAGRLRSLQAPPGKDGSRTDCEMLLEKGSLECPEGISQNKGKNSVLATSETRTVTKMN